MQVWDSLTTIGCANGQIPFKSPSALWGEKIIIPARGSIAAQGAVPLRAPPCFSVVSSHFFQCSSLQRVIAFPGGCSYSLYNWTLDGRCEIVKMVKVIFQQVRKSKRTRTCKCFKIFLSNWPQSAIHVRIFSCHPSTILSTRLWRPRPCGLGWPWHSAAANPLRNPLAQQCCSAQQRRWWPPFPEIWGSTKKTLSTCWWLRLNISMSMQHHWRLREVSKKSCYTYPHIYSLRDVIQY